MQLMQQSLWKDEAYTRPQNDMFFSCWVMCPLTPTFIYNFLNVIIYISYTDLTQPDHIMSNVLSTSSIVCRLSSPIHLLLSKCFLHLCWLVSPRPFICWDFYLHHPLYADFAHSYIYCFLNVLCIYADLYHPDPSYVQIFYLHHPLYGIQSMPTWLTHTSITFLIFMYLYWLISPRPLHVFRFVTYITHCMLTWLTHTS